MRELYLPLIQLDIICIFHWFSFLHYSLAIHGYINDLIFSLFFYILHTVKIAILYSVAKGSTILFSACPVSLSSFQWSKLSFFHFTTSTTTSNSKFSCYSLKIFAHAQQISLSYNLNVRIIEVLIIEILIIEVLIIEVLIIEVLIIEVPLYLIIMLYIVSLNLSLILLY